VAHVVLLLLVAGEDADLADVRMQEMFQDSVAEGTGTASDHEGFVCKVAHILSFTLFLIILSKNVFSQ